MMKYIRTIGIFLIAGLWSFFSIVLHPFDKNGFIHGKIMYWSSRIILWNCGIKLNINGSENLENISPAVIVMNHESALDIPVITACLTIQSRFMAKKELFRVPFFGWALSLGKHISIDRKNAKTAIRSINKGAAILVKKKFSIIVSPEGTRSPDGQIGKFKKGAFYIAKEFDLPIISITMMGNRYCVPNKSILAIPGKIDVIIDPPVSVSDFDSLTDCINSVHSTMVMHKKKYESDRLKGKVA